jgi:hypothetical protein
MCDIRGELFRMIVPDHLYGKNLVVREGYLYL